MKKAMAGFLALCGCLTLAGCLSNRYIAPLTSFNTSTAATVATISDYYASRNSFEIEIYLNERAIDPKLPVEKTDSSGHPTPLGRPVFSPEAMKARLDALTLVGKYASRLYDLANSTAPADFSTAATALGTNLNSLNTTFQTLAATDNRAAAYVTPVTSLIGTIGEMYLIKRRNDLIQDGITNGGPQVNIILGHLRDDMNDYFSEETITGASEILATKIKAYNDERASLTYDERAARLAEIKTAADAASVATASAPAQLISAMLEANNALLKAAGAPRAEKQVALASLNDALGAWSSQIQSASVATRPAQK